jgi:hypothetical protein
MHKRISDRGIQAMPVSIDSALRLAINPPASRGAGTLGVESAHEEALGITVRRAATPDVSIRSFARFCRPLPEVRL